MASTRDINSEGNYCLEQKARMAIQNNLAFYNAPNGHAFDPAYPELYRQGYMPPDNFSFNPTDIESALFGIGSTNLVEAKAPTVPQFKPMQTVSFFKKPDVVKSPTFMPLLDQRPFICRI
jgi:hypothetical protein